VKRLISPAIALMNRLPMVYKFSLISVLFLLPIGALSWLVISELNQSVQSMTRGVEGLRQLEQGEHLLSLSIEYRDYRAPGILKNDSGLLGASEQVAKQIDQLLQDLVAVEFYWSWWL